MTASVTSIVQVRDPRADQAEPAEEPGLWKPFPALLDAVRERVDLHGVPGAALELGVSEQSLTRLLAKLPVRFGTINVIDGQLRVLLGAHYDQP